MASLEMWVVCVPLWYVSLADVLMWLLQLGR